jgi:hypothetical protein
MFYVTFVKKHYASRHCLNILVEHSKPSTATFSLALLRSSDLDALMICFRNALHTRRDWPLIISVETKAKETVRTAAMF